jgi:predicted nucleic acid-binding protein
MSAKAFLDTNVLIYALTGDDPRGAVADRLLLQGGRISVQVLNEFASVAHRKLGLTWPEVIEALTQIKTLCPDPIPVDLQLHEAGLALAARHGLSIYDALVVAAAAAARCDVLYSEDMQEGRRFDAGPRIEHPFSA